MKTVWLVGVVLALVAGCEDEGRQLVSIEVGLETPALYAPGDTQATALGTYSDGVEEDITADVEWSSAYTSVGTVDAVGAVSALTPGTTKIRATLGDVHGETTFTVLNPTLETITISGPQFVPKGMFLQLAATGHYNNGTTRVLTSAVVWSSDATSIVTVDSTGRLTGLSEGGTTVHATQGAITSDYAVTVRAAVLVTLAITPNPVPAVPNGLTVELHAIGTFSDGVEIDVTDAVVWAAAQPTIATVDSTDNKGLVTAVAATGATNIYATFNAASGTITETVTVTAAPAVVVRVEIDPETLELPLGRDEPLTCNAVYSDGTQTDVTDIATWDSANDVLVTVDTEGVVTANDTTLGTTQVSCDHSTFSDEIDVETIAAVIDRIEVTPVNPDVLVGGADVQFSAERVMSNGQRVPTTCTWDAPGPALISATGLLDADTVVAGAGTVTWICDAMSGTSTYTGFETTSLSLVIEDAHGTTPPIGATLEHRAVAQTSGPSFDVTSLAVWSTTTATTIEVSATPGELTTLSAGPGDARATFDGHVATRSVIVQ